MVMITKQQYVEYLICAIGNYTSLNPADYLMNERHAARDVKEDSWIHLDDMNWRTERLQNGVRVKLKEVPFKVQLFKVVTTDSDTPALACGARESILATSFLF